MSRFRPAIFSSALRTREPFTIDLARATIADALRPGHFFVAPGADIETVYREHEEVYWEILNGQLLNPPFTGRRQSFEIWQVFLSNACEPVISVRLDAHSGFLYVTRSLYCHAWEGYHAGDNVYLSRETRKWMRELMGTIRLDRFACAGEFRDELICLVFHAVVGLSRLPLTSVESPLPVFSLGELAYVYRPDLQANGGMDWKPIPQPPMRSSAELINQGLIPELCWLEKAKLLETVLHAMPWERLAEESDRFLAKWRALGHADAEVLTLLHTLFNEVALSPYTDLVGKTLAFLGTIEKTQHVIGEAATDLLAHFLRQLGRHLTAYDLVTFHHRGANYPDALFLDAILKALLKRAEQTPMPLQNAAGDSVSEQRAKRLRRRAIRQALLLRSRYEGHPVPDAPTSEGENARVLPPPFVRVPQEQIEQIHRRTKRLFADDPLDLGPFAREALQQSVTDLQHLDELRELGMALFLDRPLGIGKAPGEPDQTLLFSYEVFSRSIAEQRLVYLANDLKILDPETLKRFQLQLATLSVRGIPLTSLRVPRRHTPVSLQDAWKVADDWLFLRNTRRTTYAFKEQFDLAKLADVCGIDLATLGQPPLLLQGFGCTDAEREALTVFDSELQPRLQLKIDASRGYESRGGCEFPVAGLKLLRVWDRAGSEIKGAL